MRLTLLRRALPLLGLVVLLCLPALLNGFPLVFDDSAHYLRKPFAALQEAARGRLSTDAADYRGYMPTRLGGGDAAPAASAPTLSGNPFFLRPAAYSVLLLPFATAWTLPLLPLGQALLVAALARALLRRVAAPGWAGWALAAVLGASAAPWFASQAMPDVLTGALALWLALVCMGGAAGAWRALGAVLLGAALIGSHLSHVPLAAGGALVGLALAWRAGLALRRRAAVLAAAWLLAVAGLLGTNLVFAKRVTLSESAPLFTLARFVGDGLAAPVLRAGCAAGEPWLLCAEPTFWALPSDDFLWRPDAPWVRHWPDRARFLAEAAAINRRVLADQPGHVAAIAATAALRQVVTLSIDPQLAEPPERSFTELMAQMGPPALTWSEASWQAAAPARLEAWRRAQDAVQRLLYAVSLAALPVLAWIAWRRRAAVPLTAAGLALALLLGNAAVTGALSAVHGRYQARIAWPVAVLALVAAVALAPRRADATDVATARRLRTSSTL